MKYFVLLTLIFTFAILGCEDSVDAGHSSGEVDSDDTDPDSSNNEDTDFPDDNSDSDNNKGWDSEDCDSLLEITVRDFNESHVDMERSDSGWGPVAGVLELTLGEDQKPVFYDAMGTHTWKTGLENGILEKNCWSSGPDTPETCYAGTIPMFEGAESFDDWYHDTTANQRFEKQVQMVDVEQNGIFVYDSNDDDGFFPLSPTDGFGITPAGNNQGKNFLFTTEIHFNFIYNQGQKFTFRGDDDLWIFVNNKMALDLGGMHLPFEGTIDFDALADELGIAPGGLYAMDVFHAERHTSDSNFRIETNISCFIPIIID